MTDPLRTDSRSTPGDVPERDRDARVEELLLAGLDHYFAGQYELAISVWTRVLFLDRGHARARAYIERARSAIAERQRETEELLHTGAAALDRGEAWKARQLLTSAVERGAASDEALALLQRLDRLDVSAYPQTGDGVRRAAVLPPDQPRDRSDPAAPSRLVWIATGVCAGLAVAALAAWLWTGSQDARSTASQPAPAPAAHADRRPLPLPSPAEASLTRARRLQAAGRLHDALAALRAIRHGDPLRAEADALGAAIQRQLLETARAIQQSGEAGTR